MATSKLPKIEAGSAAIVDTPLALDTDLAMGELTLKNENGDDALTVKISDITGWNKSIYSAGTANNQTVDLTGVTLLADNVYSMSVKLPYTVNFFGGGGHATADARESDAIYVTRTYTVSTDATPTATELAAAFALRVTNDIQACFSATAALGVITFVADDANSGSFIFGLSNLTGAVVVDTVPWVTPSGTIAQVLEHLPAALVIGAGYQRFIIEYNEALRHNAVKGLQVLKPSRFVYYIDKDDAGSAAAVALLESILDGSLPATSKYLGAPAM